MDEWQIQRGCESHNQFKQCCKVFAQEWTKRYLSKTVINWDHTSRRYEGYAFIVVWPGIELNDTREECNISLKFHNWTLNFFASSIVGTTSPYSTLKADFLSVYPSWKTKQHISILMN